VLAPSESFPLIMSLLYLIGKTGVTYHPFPVRSEQSVCIQIDKSLVANIEIFIFR